MAATSPSSQQLFGLDLHLLARDVRGAWRRLLEGRALAALTPALPVRLLRADGSDSFWLVDAGAVRPAAGLQEAPFVAVELPEDDVLFRTLVLPALGEAELRQAVALDVMGASPFAPDDLVWSHATRPLRSGMVEAVAALASRKQVARVLEHALARVPLGSAPEVWAWQQPFPPVVLPGFGESRRAARAARGRRVAGGLVLLALGLAAAIALTPTAQLRMRAVEAVTAMDHLVRRTEAVVKQRGQLTASLDAATAVAEMTAQRSHPLRVLELLTQALPDDTSLLGLTLDGNKVSMNGMTANAAALMQQLSLRPEFRDVKAPTPATRPLGSSKDLFTIELTLVPPATQASGADAAPGAGAPAAPTTAAVATGAASAPAPTAAVPPPPPGPAAAGAATAAPPPAAASGGPSFGGATFGGAAARTP